MKRIPTWLLALAVPLAVSGCSRCGEPGLSDRPETSGYRRPPVIDAHVHLSPFAMPIIHRVMEDSGVDIMVNLSGGNPARLDFDLSLKMAAAMSGKIVNCFNPDWTRVDEPDFGTVEAARMEQAVEAGFACFKVSKALGLYVRYANDLLVAVDDPVMDPLYEAAGRLGIPVYQHVADPKAFFEPPDEDNERYEELRIHPHWSFHGGDWPSFHQMLEAFERVVAKHPGTTFVGVHFGNAAEEPDRVARMLDRYPNYHVDVAARVPEFGRHPAEGMRKFFLKYQNRILFGTDIGISPRHLTLGSSGDDEPDADDARNFYSAHYRYFETRDRDMAHPTPIQGDWTIDAIGLPPEVLDKLYSLNAMNLLDIKPRQP